MLEDLKNYQPAPDLLKGRVILVTGAGNGIGATAAYTFAKYGATVVMLGRTMRKLEEVYDAIEQAGFPQPAIIPMNLETAAPKEYEALAETLENEFGRLDGLLHNAAMLGPLTPLAQYSLEQWSKVMQTNLNAPFLLTQSLLGLLKNADDASVVFTSSSVGRKGRAYWGAYAISKAANENMMQVFADELETNTNIRFNSLNPGRCRTGMRARAFPGEDPNQNPLPSEIMGAYLYLMGPESTAVNGQQLDAQ